MDDQSVFQQDEEQDSTFIGQFQKQYNDFIKINEDPLLNNDLLVEHFIYDDVFSKFTQFIKEDITKLTSDNLFCWFPIDPDFLAHFFSLISTNLFFKISNDETSDQPQMLTQGIQQESKQEFKQEQPNYKKLILVLTEWSFLVPLLISFKKKDLLKSFHITFEIFQQEHLLSPEKEHLLSNNICKANQELLNNDFNQPMIFCKNICPLKEQFPNSFNNECSIDLNETDDIEDLFQNKSRCPVIELQNYNQNQIHHTSSGKIDLIITSKSSFPFYLERESLFSDGINHFKRIFEENRVIYLGKYYIFDYFVSKYNKTYHLNSLRVIKNELEKIFNKNKTKYQTILKVITTFYQCIDKNNFNLSNNLLFEKSEKHNFFEILKSLECQYQSYINQIIELLFIGKSNNYFIYNYNIENDILTVILLSNHKKFFSGLLAFNISSQTVFNLSNSKLNTFISMFIAKENQNFDFLMDFQDANQFGKNVLRIDYGRMFGIRIFNWYPLFYITFKDYLADKLHLSNTLVYNKMLHLTGSPGIGKSTFIYYLVFRAIQTGDLNVQDITYYGIRLHFSDQSKNENILILKLGSYLYLGQCKSFIECDPHHTFNFSSLYCIHDCNLSQIQQSSDISIDPFEIHIVCDIKNIEMIIKKPINERYYILNIFDGKDYCKSEPYQDYHSLLCTSYSASCIRGKRHLGIIAPVCHVNEFMNTLLLCNDGNRKKRIELSLIIIQYINLNIRDTLSIADKNDIFSIKDYLKNIIFEQANDKTCYPVPYDNVYNKTYIFIISPMNYKASLYREDTFDTMIHFTSDISQKILLKLKSQNKLINDESLIELIVKIINLQKPASQGLIFENYGE
ncbi:hypothetical protein TRFO_38464 [Tritrichomonas foetus]|uniref:Uncharacterized protein n=1 Tax=Tritrichomonas foetus TaxID=1144522 RepID=A0A1J4JB41_9EUKA|nr:hypothetical protein TRFO_38464 [Tritrichomonas foetus]|eukprot:OHS95455.1 hypothetical protein TRFO_38464 [Tritrichomonas foetus]